MPEILDIVTADDVIYNTCVTQFATRTDIYGTAGTFASPQVIDHNDQGALMHWKASNLIWNSDYKPWFYRDIWPILFRADEYTYLTNVLQQSNYPHNQTQRGNFDPDKLSIAPRLNDIAFQNALRRGVEQNQSGELFLEALDATIFLLDDKYANQGHPIRKTSLAIASTQDDIRQNLRTALSDFARKVDRSATDEDPGQYLARWQARYQEAQQGGGESAGEYNAASKELHDAITDILKKLEAIVEPKPPTPKVKALARREPSPQAQIDPNEPVEAAFERLSKEFRTGKLLSDRFEKLRIENTFDPYRNYRSYLYDLLREDGEENVFRAEGSPTSRIHHLPLMPLLSGDNPISNVLPSKFLRVTDYQLFLLRQWCHGLFFNEVVAGWVPGNRSIPGSLTKTS